MEGITLLNELHYISLALLIIGKVLLINKVQFLEKVKGDFSGYKIGIRDTHY